MVGHGISHMRNRIDIEVKRPLPRGMGELRYPVDLADRGGSPRTSAGISAPDWVRTL